MKSLLFVTLIVFSMNTFSQNLNAQRIWKISAKKRSIFLDKGVFHIDDMKGSNELIGLRNSYVKSRGYERLVFDFKGNTPPRLYGHLSKDKNKVFIDFFNTTLKKSIPSISQIKYIKSVDFFTIDKNNLSVELNLSNNVSYDIFYLTNPGRLVIDIQ